MQKLDLNDRESIAIGILRKQPLAKIGTIINRRYCNEDRYFYDAKVADRNSHMTRKTASDGVHLTEAELSSIDVILTVGIKSGQPLSHLFATYEKELIISERTA